jgi:hypothetical protein
MRPFREVVRPNLLAVPVTKSTYIADPPVTACAAAVGRPLGIRTEEYAPLTSWLDRFLGLRLNHGHGPYLLRLVGWKNSRTSIFRARASFSSIIETIENALGGEAHAGETLGVLREIKALKKAANEPTGDERHAPKDPASTPHPADLGQAWENTRAVVRAYERFLLNLRS